MTTATKPLNLKSGEFYKTALGEVVEIVSWDMTNKSDFPITGYTADDRCVGVSWDGVTKCGDRLTEKVEKAVVVPPVDTYLEACIDDELALAPLLNWQNFCRPMKITPTVYLQGTHNKHHGHKVRNGSVFMPQWRRSSSAAELIAKCKLTIATTDGGVAVHAETGPVFRAAYSEHPSEDFAVWFAICKAAIAYLRAPP